MELNRRLLWAGWHLDALALALYALTLALMAGLAADPFGLGLLVAVGWLLAALVWLGRVLKWCFHYFYPPSPSHEPGNSWKHFGLLPLLAATLLGLSCTDWPRSLVFQLHRPALERFARQELSQKRAFKPDAPARRVGLYLIWRVEQVPGGVRFVTRDSSFLDRSYDGFVFYSGAPGAASGAKLPTFPLGPYEFAHRKEQLDQRWFAWWAGSTFD